MRKLTVYPRMISNKAEPLNIKTVPLLLSDERIVVELGRNGLELAEMALAEIPMIFVNLDFDLIISFSDWLDESEDSDESEPFLIFWDKSIMMNSVK